MSGKKKKQKKKNECKNSALLLGRDVWLEILQYFDDPRDIICLRMVSKPLQGFTLESVVWNRFLRIQCAVNYVPACTFPFSDMDRNQLELAALRPFRMAHKLLSPEPMCVSQSVLRLCPNITAAESATEKIMETAIIPGGRYLVTISSAQLIVVWDLWSSLLPKGDRKLCPRALALIDPPEPLPGEISVNIQLTPTKNSSSYRIILGVDGDEENVWNFYHLVVDLLQLSTRKEKNNMKEGVWEALGTSLADVITTPDGR
ncbi:hypothetical protein DL93DRAFT_1945467 [Clavulina sp. PMI_390]|nr:hypothetical protein DL93DRAFT_1945467 [Clavulina sp. PMI_390]